MITITIENFFFTVVSGDILLFQFDFQVVDRVLGFCHGDLCSDIVPSVSVMKAGLKLKIVDFSQEMEGAIASVSLSQPFRHIPLLLLSRCSSLPHLSVLLIVHQVYQKNFAN